MRKLALIAEFLMIGLVLSGCNNVQKFGEPNKITFEAAMTQLATGLNSVYDIRKDHPKSGLVPSEVTIEFNIAAGGKEANKLYLEAAIPAVNIAKAGFEANSAYEASRGNKITIKFVNLFLCNSKDSLVDKEPNKLAKLIEVLSGKNNDGSLVNTLKAEVPPGSGSNMGNNNSPIVTVQVSPKPGNNEDVTTAAQASPGSSNGNGGGPLVTLGVHEFQGLLTPNSEDDMQTKKTKEKLIETLETKGFQEPNSTDEKQK